MQKVPRLHETKVLVQFVIDTQKVEGSAVEQIWPKYVAPS